MGCMKIVGLDIGDQWTGTAISDAIGMFARPLKTVVTTDLVPFLQELLTKEKIGSLVVGIPVTMKGTESEQTKKVKIFVQDLQKKIAIHSWIFWDERLSSQHAQKLKHAKTKADKIQSHSVAAAFILGSYLDHLSLLKKVE